MKSAGRLKREHFSTQHVVKLCKSWPRDIMETKITNGFKSWWGNLAEDRATSFCSKLCPGWKPRSPYVTRSCERGEGHSVPALLLVCFVWAFPSDHTQGMDPREALLLGVTTVLFCYAFKISDWRIYFYLCAFPRLPSLSQVGDPNVSVCLSLSALQNVRETAHPPFTKGLLPQEESAGMGKALRDWQPPSSSSHSVWCPGERAMQTLPCQRFSRQPSQDLPPLGCIQFLWVRHRERGK